MSGPFGPTAFSPYSTPVTNQFGDGLAHQVYDRYVTQNADDGVMFALCGQRIVPAPMASPEGKPCEECETKIRHLKWSAGHPHRSNSRRWIPRPTRRK